MKNIKRLLNKNYDYLFINTYTVFQRPRAAAEISPVNECRKIKVELDPTFKVSVK